LKSLIHTIFRQGLEKQMSIEDFVFPYGKLKSSNRWVIMAGLIPWDDIERDYAEGFVNNGAPAHPARMALGSLIIKQILGCSDEELICQVMTTAMMTKTTAKRRWHSMPVALYFLVNSGWAYTRVMCDSGKGLALIKIALYHLALIEAQVLARSIFLIFHSNYLLISAAEK